MKWADGTLTFLSPYCVRIAMIGNPQEKRIFLLFCNRPQIMLNYKNRETLFFLWSYPCIFVKELFLPLIRSVLDSLWNYSTAGSHSTLKNLVPDPDNVCITASNQDGVTRTRFILPPQTTKKQNKIHEIIALKTLYSRHRRTVIPEMGKTKVSF